MTTTETALDTLAHLLEALVASQALPVCPNCGDHFIPGGRGLGKTFCTKACREEANNRNKARGAVLAPLTLAWLETRHAKPGTEEAAICADARREIAHIGRIFREEDKAAGRPPASAHAAMIMRPADQSDSRGLRPYAERSPMYYEDRRRSSSAVEVARGRAYA